MFSKSLLFFVATWFFAGLTFLPSFAFLKENS